MPLDARLALAKRYNQHWPDCLACALYLADWSLESGDSAMAVALLHQAAARDVSAQVADRIWTKKKSSRELWPSQLELQLRAPIPAQVAAMIGMNQLVDGDVDVDPTNSSISPVEEHIEPLEEQRSKISKVWAPVLQAAGSVDDPAWLEDDVSTDKDGEKIEDSSEPSELDPKSYQAEQETHEGTGH